MDKHDQVKAKVGEVVDKWFMEVFHGHGFTVEQYNRFYAARDDLKVRIQTALTKKEE